jgi:hypothetical protein
MKSAEGAMDGIACIIHRPFNYFLIHDHLSQIILYATSILNLLSS